MMKKLTRDILQWDIKSWSKALIFWDKNVDWNQVQNGLELGAGQGGLSLWLAMKGKETICSDFKDVKNRAEKLYFQYNVNSLIKYQDIDARDIPYNNFFDIIVFKSILGAIGRNDNYQIQIQVFKEIYKALKPGGKLLFAENLIASPLHQSLRKRYMKWGKTWRYVSLTEIKIFLKEFSDYDVITSGFLGAMGRTEWHQNIFATIDTIVLNKVCPDRWKYIVYGIAKK